MVLKIGRWFEVECSRSYIYVRVWRQEAMLTRTARRFTFRTGASSGVPPRATFRVVI